MTALNAQIAQLLDVAADRYHVPRPLARAVAWIESRGNPNARSPAGAIGIMQLMPATAKSLGVADPYDPRANIEAGVKYLAQLIARYGERAGLAAYNWGPGHVSNSPIDSTWPSEVRTYVTNVLQRAEYELATMGVREAAPPFTPSVSSPPVSLSSVLRSSRPHAVAPLDEAGSKDDP